MENYVASVLAEIYGYVPQLESKRLLLCRLGLFDEEVLLLGRVLNASARYVEILGLYLDAGEFAAE